MDVFSFTGQYGPATTSRNLIYSPLAGHYPRLSLDRERALEIGLRQTHHVLDAVATSGVKRLIYVSSTATVAPARDGFATEQDVFAAPPMFGAYHDLKWAMEDAVLAETRFEVAVACPGACLGPFDLRVGTSAFLVALARGMDPPHPDGIVNVVDVRDVAEALVRLVSHPSPPRRVLLSGGDHRLQPLLASLATRYGVAPPSSALTAQEAIELADQQERAAAARGGRPQLSREIVDLVVHGTPISARLAETTLNVRWRPLAETLAAFDAWGRRTGFLPSTHLEETHA